MNDLGSSTEGEKYKTNYTGDETRGSSNPTKKESFNFWDALSDLGNLRLPKMVLILLFANYAVVAFSRGEKGVRWYDFLYLLSFSILSVLLFVSLIFLRSVWAKYNEQILRKCKKFVK